MEMDKKKKNEELKNKMNWITVGRAFIFSSKVNNGWLLKTH